MINIAGIISVIIFYLLILGVGLWAARKNEGGEGDQEEEVSMVIKRISDATNARLPCLV